jgi:hypothetical protein
MECWSRLQSHIPAGYKIPAALANDNFQGYVHPFIVLNKVKWIEAVTACPFFSSQVTYYVEGKAKARHTLAGEELGRAERAYGTRGNIYSYILPWESILRNAACVTTEELFKSWPHPPDVVAHMIRFIFQGADEQHCMAWLKELHVRSHVLVGLGRIYAEHLHELVSETPTAKDLLSRAENIARYESNVREHYPEERFGAEEGGLSEEIKEAALEALKKHKEQEWSRLNQTEQLEGKNAAPDDPAIAPDDKIFANVRPCILQEDSSARGVDEDVQVSGALANFSDYNTKLHGNVLHESWAPRYTSMILPWTFNYMSGGPEYANWYTEVPEERWRRHKDAAVLDPDRYCKNVARRAEMQFGGHWTALPIARNLAVRYQALKRAFLMVGRRRQSGMPLADSANEFLKAAKTLFERLDRGTVLIHGKKRPINGDVGLLRWADDLQQSEKELLDLYKK